MKRFLTILAAGLLTLLLTVPALAQTWYPANQKAIAWDPVTTMGGGAPLPAGSTVEYKIWIKGLVQTTPALLGQTDKTEYTVSFTNEGKYFVGVQTVRLEAGAIVAESDISWSDMADRVANQQIFGIQYYQAPGHAGGIRPK